MVTILDSWHANWRELRHFGRYHWRLRIGRRTIYFHPHEMLALRKMVGPSNDAQDLKDAKQEIAILKEELVEIRRANGQFGVGA